MNRILVRLLPALLAALPMWSAVVAAEPFPGAAYPHQLNAPDQKGAARTLHSAMGRKGVVRLRYQEPTFRTRPDLDAMIADMRKLGL